MALPTITATGRVASDPDLKYGRTGTAYTRLRIACTERKKNQAGQWEDGATTWLDITAFAALAEAAAEHLTRGSTVTVTGRLEQREVGDKTYYRVKATDLSTPLQSIKTVQRQQAPTNDPWAIE
ncbi:single-stranded DNA-binding protein [Actinopolymorpha sp. NPDC004070]|uniref:single-stranded DNA-binding protein n=1 Tax=Actinopolymorpha sp. NPDC004070 TaxID=3154548 RepID=UPI0033BBC42E